MLCLVTTPRYEEEHIPFWQYISHVGIAVLPAERSDLIGPQGLWVPPSCFAPAFRQGGSDTGLKRRLLDMDAFEQRLASGEPPESIGITKTEWTSLVFLYNYDACLLGAVEQLFLLGRGPELRQILSSFDLQALQARASKVLNKNCEDIHLLAVGGYNMVFLLLFDDGTDIVARLRDPGEGIGNRDPSTTPEEIAARFVSEVATLRFLNENVSIPVPTLYDWDSEWNNAIRAPYMLMQRISGHLLRDLRITSAGWERLAAQVAGFEAEICNHPLRSIGSLIDPDGSMGHIVQSCTSDHMPSGKGPFSSSKEYLFCYVDRILDDLKDLNRYITGRTHCSKMNGGVDALPAAYAQQWFQLLRDALAKLPDELPRHRDLFRLAHYDFNENNLLFSVSSPDNPTIVGILDWEGTRVVPAWDGRKGCNISWILNIVCNSGHDQSERNNLLKIYNDVLSTTGRKLGWSPLCFEHLVGLLATPIIILSQEQLHTQFLSWFDEAEAASGGLYKAELEAFRPLKLFIDAQQSE
ncbi:altered inheritance of mitochondria protein 9, mitochondrial [Favolaschia claudopus]|uniref:Altered inheritance of mitochondria protein 9, mitochondrial n=1 Tax=Favolaschia claudopus TaxID=2862362 RepID=A0AAW0EHP2_9AGAR